MDIKSKKLIVFLIFIFLIFFPLGEIARFNLGDISITLLDLGVGVISLLYLSRIISKNKKITGTLLKPILFFLLVCLVSLSLNINILKQYESFSSFMYLVRYALYVSVYFWIKDLNIQLKKTISSLMIFSGFIILLVGFVQYFLYPDLRNLYYLGWDEHLYRMFSTFLDPNFLGSFLVLYLFFVLRTKDIKINFKIILIILTGIGIFLTFSRSAYGMLLSVGLIYGFLTNKRKMFIVVSIFFIILGLVIVKVSNKSEGTNLFRTASNTARIKSMQNALIIFKDRPFFGVGFNSYRYAQRKYGFIDDNKKFVHSGAGTDNAFLFILATTGVIGFLGFSYLLYSIFKFSFSDYFLFSSFVGLILNSLFINSFFYPFMMFWMWASIGLKENS